MGCICSMAKLIFRKKYIKKLLAYKDIDLIKVVTGLRRSGKSTLLELYRSELKKLGIQPDQTIFLECHLYLSMNLIFVFVQQAAQGITKGFLQTFGLNKNCILNATSPIF